MMTVAAVVVLAACAPAGSATGGATTPATAGGTASAQPPTPNVPIPDSRTPQPAVDTAPPGPPTVHPAGEPAPVSGGSRAADSTHLAQLEHEALAIAKNTGCSRDDQCRNVPVGIKACGGARYYLKYCVASTDTVALFRKLGELATAERAYNAKYHIVSTCMMITPTRPHLEGGVCK
jgi:hypothetical protein